MQPPCASTMPLQMDRPSPALAGNGDRHVEPLPHDVDVMGDVSGEYRAALKRRLFRTWTMRRRSAITLGGSVLQGGSEPRTHP